MSNTVNVRSIQALEDQRTAFNRFNARCREALDVAAHEIRRTENWLAERASYWRGQVMKAEEELRQAQRALSACQASGDRDHPPNCGTQMYRVSEARRALDATIEEFQKVLKAQKALAEAAEAYGQQAQRFATLLNNQTPRATAFLSNKITALQGYIAMHGATDAGGAFFAGLGLSSAVWQSAGGQAGEPITVVDTDTLEQRVAQVQEAKEAEEATGWQRLADTADERAERETAPAPAIPRNGLHPTPPGTHMHGGQAETTRGTEQERGPESYEGELGTPERRG